MMKRACLGMELHINQSIIDNNKERAAEPQQIKPQIPHVIFSSIIGRENTDGDSPCQYNIPHHPKLI